MSCGKAAARKLVHARVLLLADVFFGDERPDDQIVAAPGGSPRTDSRVRRELVTEGFNAALSRRGQPPEFSELWVTWEAWEVPNEAIWGPFQ